MQVTQGIRQLKYNTIQYIRLHCTVQQNMRVCVLCIQYNCLPSADGVLLDRNYEGIYGSFTPMI